MTHVKFINKKTIEYPPKSFLTPEGEIIEDFDTNIEALTKYGYKEFVPSGKSRTQYVITYEQTSTQVIEVAIQYVKFVSETLIKYPPKNYKTDEGITIFNFNINEDALIKEGYKPYEPAEREIGKAYTITYKELKTKIKEIATEIVPDPEEQLKQAKQAKIEENDRKRDVALNAGVTYKDILFDSDTDQKVNLLATISNMDEDTTITWFGMDNKQLDCTKGDLSAIGNLIIGLHSYCWNKNAQIKGEIESAKTVEGVEGIEIEYNTDTTAEI